MKSSLIIENNFHMFKDSLRFLDKNSIVNYGNIETNS